MGSIPCRLTHSSTPSSCAGIPSLPQRGQHRDDGCRVVIERVIRETTTAIVQLPDADKVQLQQVGLVDACQPTGARVMACCRAKERRKDQVPGRIGLAFAAIFTVCAPRIGGNQISLNRCTASAGIQHRAAADGKIQRRLRRRDRRAWHNSIRQEGRRAPQADRRTSTSSRGSRLNL